MKKFILIVLFLYFNQLAWAANSTVSALPNNTSATGTDLLYDYASSTDYNVTLAQVKTYVLAGNSFISTYPGAGVPNSTGSAWGTSYSVSGNTTKLASSNGTLTSGDCVKIDANGNYIDAGSACGSGGGGGGSLTVTDGTNSVSSTTSLTFSTGLISGSGGSATYNPNPFYSGSGSATSITPDCTKRIYVYNTTASTGTFTINAPTTCTPVEGQDLLIKVITTNAQTLSLNSAYIAGQQIPLPTSTGASSTNQYIFTYDATASKWICNGVN